MKLFHKNLNGLLLIFFLTLVLPSITFGAADVLIREVSGAGPTPELAISSALIEAIQQVYGVELEAVQQLRNQTSKLTTQTFQGKDVTRTSKNSLSENILSKAKGLVKSYSVLQSRQREDGVFQAILRVEFPIYSPLGQDRSPMRTMAILTFRIGLALSRQNDSQDLAEFSLQLNQKLISQMAQARKFRVLEREYLKEFFNEQEILKSGELPVTEMARLGHRLGADYILVGTITDYRMTEQTKEYYGVKVTKRMASLSFEYRVVEVAHQEIRWANTYRFFGDNADLDAQTIFEESATSIVTEILNVIYPIKVMVVSSPNEILVNQGGIRVRENDLFDVYAPGREIRDPDTGVPMEVDGSKVGTIEITNVLPKYSVGRMIEGQFNNVSPNAICRPKKRIFEASSLYEEEHPVPPGSSEKPVNW
jgi:TolB-like protein